MLKTALKSTQGLVWFLLGGVQESSLNAVPKHGGFSSGNGHLTPLRVEKLCKHSTHEVFTFIKHGR